MENRTGQNFQTAQTLSHEILAGSYHYFAFAAEKPLIFQPGQYISIKVAKDRLNCYSIASYDSKNEFGLLVDISPGGPGSKFFENLKPGDKIAYLGPLGTFTLKKNDGANHLLFLATGCGIAPLRCQIDAALKKENIKEPITLYFGLSFPKDLFWQDHFQTLSKDYPNFNFKIAVWKPDSTWQGPSGFITQFLKKDLPDAKMCSAYLCGNPNMITDASHLLTESGLRKERIYTEKL